MSDMGLPAVGLRGGAGEARPAVGWHGTSAAPGELDLDTEIEVRLAVLAARYDQMLRRYLTRLARRREVAEDLVQQLWLRLLEAARAGRFVPVDEAALRSYLFTAARNLFVDECLRKHASSRTTACDHATLESLLGESELTTATAPDAACGRDQLRGEVERAIAGLPLAQQEVISQWMAGASIEGMIASTGACRDTVLSRKKYAMRRLSVALGHLRDPVPDSSRGAGRG